MDEHNNDKNPPEDGFKMRKAPRDSLFMHGLLYLPDHPQPATVRIRNLARGGLMADYPGALPKDSLIQLELRNVGLVSGRVAWSSPTQFGMQFDAEIDPQAVRRPVGKGDGEVAPTLRPYSSGDRRTLRS